MSLVREYVAALSKHWAIVAVATILGALVGWGVAHTSPAVFVAESKIIASYPSSALVSAQELQAGNTYVESRVQTYVALGGSSSVLDPAAEAMGLADSRSLTGSVVASAAAQSTLITVRATADSAQESADMANAVAKSLVFVVHQIETDSADPLHPRAQLDIVQTAVPPKSSSAASTTMYLLVGTFVGFALGFTIAVILWRMRGVVRGLGEIAEVTGTYPIGSVPGAFGAAPRSRERFDEAVRTLAATLTATKQPLPRSIVVTSPDGAEPGAMVAIAFARALAENGLRVLLVDANLRNSESHAILGVERAPGLSDLIDSTAQPTEAVRREADSFFVLPAGTLAKDEALLSSSTSLDVLRPVLAEFEVTVFTSPRVDQYSDAIRLLGSTGGSALVLARVDKTSSRLLARTISLLAGGGIPLLGVVAVER